MKKNKTVNKKVIVGIIVVVAVALGFVLRWQFKPVDKLYQVRNALYLTPAKQVLPVTVTLGNTDARFRVYDIRISKDGMSPLKIVVNRGDRVQFDVTAVDGKYDMGVKQFGFYIDSIPEGRMTSGSFSAGESGTFPFGCSLFCPQGTHGGELVVLD